MGGRVGQINGDGRRKPGDARGRFPFCLGGLFSRGESDTLFRCREAQ
jgi:hypothetical protein